MAGASGRPEPQEDEEDEEEALPHSEAVDVFQEGLAMVVQDPLLCDLPIQVRMGRGLFPRSGAQRQGEDRFGGTDDGSGPETSRSGLRA